MDVFTPHKRSEIMRAVKSEDTKPEMLVRRLLHRAGYRYRLHDKKLPGTPDLTFAGRRAVIFVHGCFWHQHPGCAHAARPTSNGDFWRQKLDRNVARDAKNLAALETDGWRVLTLWECELKRPDLLERIRAFLDFGVHRTPNE
jgi:DNA mismatch endonuclease (patch repair protein)